ncbi:MAG: glycosyltransferase [Pirellulaceae bacterium]|nr:glycosyltransferase [Pirellulaceae bacterium]
MTQRTVPFGREFDGGPSHVGPLVAIGHGLAAAGSESVLAAWKAESPARPRCRVSNHAETLVVRGFVAPVGLPTTVSEPREAEGVPELPHILVAIHNLYTEATSGAARSVRTMTEWLAAAGFPCRVLATTRPDGLGIADSDFAENATKPAVTTLVTHHHRADQPDREEASQYLALLDGTFEEFRPDVLLTYGAHPLVREVLRRARRRGVSTVFTVRNYGYEDRRWFEHVDHVLTNSPFLTRYYERAIGLRSTPIESPIAWSEADAGLAFQPAGPAGKPVLPGAGLTFVNPSLHKGAALFARLADMLGTRRPDIPISVVQSAADGAVLGRFPEVDLSRYSQIAFRPATAKPAEFLARTKLLLVPSVFAEPFGRVAVEAMLNGIPPLVSDRGALQETVRGAGCVLPVPPWLMPTTARLPSPAEVQPWFDAVCRLWDDLLRYARASAAARSAAELHYGETALKRRYCAYFSSVGRRSVASLSSLGSRIRVGDIRDVHTTIS